MINILLLTLTAGNFASRLKQASVASKSAIAALAKKILMIK